MTTGQFKNGKFDLVDLTGLTLQNFTNHQKVQPEELVQF